MVDEKYSVVVFVAIDNAEKRMPIYNALARRLIRVQSEYSLKENVKIQQGVMTMLVHNDVDAQTEHEIERIVVKKT